MSRFRASAYALGISATLINTGGHILAKDWLKDWLEQTARMNEENEEKPPEIQYPPMIETGVTGSVLGIKGRLNVTLRMG